MDALNGVSIDDMDITYVKLPRGKYLIDGEIVECDSWNYGRAQCKNVNDIRMVSEASYIKEYRCGDDVMSVAEYEDTLEKLKNECVKDTDDNRFYFKDLESEFKYRKFYESWETVYAREQIISDPIKVEIEHIQYDTGCPFIKSAFLNGLDNKDTLYIYNQEAAWLDIVKKCFDELEMTYVDGISYSKTSNEKIWGNSKNSCIRYVVAFGTYIFDDNFKTPHVLKGTLGDMRKKYDDDVNAIRDIIKTKYFTHFGRIDVGRFNFDKLIKTLEAARRSLDEVQSTKRTTNYLFNCEDLINDAIAQINNAREV